MIFGLTLLIASLVVDVSRVSANLPEDHMSVVELIEHNGYSAQSHTVETKDGYFLKLHRIPFGRNESSGDRQSGRPVVFLQHGLLGSSADWVSNLPNQSLAFKLADSGFDVWMGNSRGNVYSRMHRTYSPTSVQFWQFSWDQMAQFDLEPMIDRALNVSEQTSLHYVGYSQGTLIMFAKLSENSAFNSKIRQFFALAPVATVGHIEGLLKFLATRIFSYKLAQLLCGRKQFLLNEELVEYFSVLLCGIDRLNPLCDNVLFQIVGPESDQFNTSRLTVYLGHTPAGTSTMNMFHWIQMVNSGTMSHYDYESAERNIRHYGQKTAPVYNLSTINVPVYLYWSDSDWLADSQDIKQSLLSVLPRAALKENNRLPSYNHLDFIWGLRAFSQIYAPLIERIKRL